MYQPPIHSTMHPPPASVMRRMPPGTRYLGEDATYWYFVHPGENPALGGFFDKLGNMFTRMVKFTPKSFTPGNIYKGFVNGALTMATMGVYQVLPKHFKKQVYNAGKIAIPVVAGAALAYTAGPAVMSALGPKLSSAASLLGKGVSTIGGRLFDFLGKMPQHAQAAMASQITPEQIAQMETSNQLPPSLEPMFQQAMAQTMPGETTGAASLYAPQPQAGEVVKPEGGGFDPTLLLVIGAPLAVIGLMSRGKR